MFNRKLNSLDDVKSLRPSSIPMPAVKTTCDVVTETDVCEWTINLLNSYMVRRDLDTDKPLTLEMTRDLILKLLNMIEDRIVNKKGVE